MIIEEPRLLTDHEWDGMLPLSKAPFVDWSGSCTLDDRQYSNLPLLRDRKGRVIYAPTAWLLHLALTRSRQGTIEKHAYVLKMYWTFLGGRSWTDVSSDLMRLWRNWLREGPRSGRRINFCIDVVVAFYRWSQEVALVHAVVGETPPGGRPYPIRLVRSRGRGRQLVCDVREHAARPVRQEVPELDDVDRLYERLSGPNEALSVRNCLIADMAMQCGLRRDEILSMSTDDVPSKALLQDLLEHGKAHRLLVTGKGGKTRAVPVLPELMLKVRDYVQYHRSNLLGPTTRVEKALFLSSRTGRRVNAEWISRLFSAALGSAKRRKLTLHRLRARYASLVVLTLARRELTTRGLTGIREDLVLHAAAEVLGHADTSTLRFYVSLALKTLHAEDQGSESPANGFSVDRDVLAAVARQSKRGTH